jgi:hypothetical protein
MDLRKKGWGGIYWIDLAQDRDQWRALVNTRWRYEVPKCFQIISKGVGRADWE